MYYCVGDIVDAGEEGISGAVVPGDIVKLADNKKVQGLVLRVNSGGGSAFASEQIWEALQYFKSKGKPFYVSMGDYAASGVLQPLKVLHALSINLLSVLFVN